MTTAADDTTLEVRLLREACRRLGLVDVAGESVSFKLAVKVYGSPAAAHHKAGNLYAALKGRRQLPRQVLVEVLAMVLDEDNPKGDIPNANATSILLHYPATWTPGVSTCPTARRSAVGRVVNTWCTE